MKSYKITYEKEGTRKTDYVVFHAPTIGNAISQFLNFEHQASGYRWTYNVDAIVDIEKIHEWEG